MNYEYFPHAVHLSDEESELWKKLTKQISFELAKSKKKDNSTGLSDKAKMLLIQRSRIAKKARVKTGLATNVIKKEFTEGQSWLVYCEDSDQLNEMLLKLRAEGLRPLEYHSNMSGEKADALNWFKKFGGVLVSIKCLDEGVDIPAVSHAFILASSQNPRQFIQRRGRVLRKSAEKNLAVTRYLAGLRRYEILESEQPNPLTFIDHLKSAPPWLLNAPIALLNLSVRSNNVCAAHELKTIGDFAKYGLKGLYKLPNLGQKSVHEISREMVHLFTTGHPLKAVETKLEWVIPARLGGPGSESESESDGSTNEYDTKESRCCRQP